MIAVTDSHRRRRRHHHNATANAAITLGTFNEMGLEMDAAQSPVAMGLAIDGTGAGEGGLVIGGQASPDDGAVVGLDLTVGGTAVVKSLKFNDGGDGQPEEASSDRAGSEPT